MPRLSKEAAQAQHDAFVLAIKRMDGVPPLKIVDFTVDEYGLPFLRALKHYAESLKAPRRGVDGTFNLYRARLVPTKAPSHLEIFRIWAPRPDYRD